MPKKEPAGILPLPEGLSITTKFSAAPGSGELSEAERLPRPEAARNA